MAMNMAGSPGGGGRRGRRAPVMAEINVTPMVDVMLVLLIIFMVAAPLMTSSIDIDLPSPGGKPEQAKPAADAVGQAHRRQLQFNVDSISGYADSAELLPKIKAIRRPVGGRERGILRATRTSATRYDELLGYIRTRVQGEYRDRAEGSEHAARR
jgi:biopolymer transport protein ExbD/biopolymer transport protein TolR